MITSMDQLKSQSSENETFIGDNIQMSSLLAVRVSVGKAISEIIS